MQAPSHIQADPRIAGVHLFADFWGCPTGLLVDPAGLEEMAVAAADAVGATVCKVSTHAFPAREGEDLGGITVVVILAESHLSIHTYPEAGFVAVDIYTCGTTCEPERGYELLKDRLLPARASVSLVSRGVSAPDTGALA